ncbi:hypothetical protein ENSA5_65930 [Enhygromyxa salina]|uniref:Uncharacterized protein n=1 Tax=Enhygromyxa salina TaxID=215803 RepID=A0A2S9XBR3_9BACT|nr:hypothetical protein [Enhygromyxa salina]PRP90297.1 hypothetical protein ENSA5_65930 [Enhygromyxa salina]
MDTRLAYSTLMASISFEGSGVLARLVRLWELVQSGQAPVWDDRRRLSPEALFEPNSTGLEAHDFMALAELHQDHGGEAPTIGMVVRGDALARDECGLGPSPWVPRRYLPIGWQDQGETIFFIDPEGVVYSVATDPQNPFVEREADFERVAELPRA